MKREGTHGETSAVEGIPVLSDIVQSFWRRDPTYAATMYFALAQGTAKWGKEACAELRFLSGMLDDILIEENAHQQESSCIYTQ